MQPDRYTKTVLTVIAAALVALVAQNAASTAMAQAERPQLQRVTICQPDGSNCSGLPMYSTAVGRDRLGVVVVNR